MPGYLDDEDETLPYFMRSGGLVAPPPNLPVAPPPGSLPQPTPTGLSPLDVQAQRTAAAGQNVADIQGRKPQATPPKWWQRLGSAGVGALGGYLNSSGQRVPQVDPSGIERQILFPGLDRKTAAWQTELESAQTKAAAEQQALKNAETVQSEKTQESLRKKQEAAAEATTAVKQKQLAQAEQPRGYAIGKFAWVDPQGNIHEAKDTEPKPPRSFEQLAAEVLADKTMKPEDQDQQLKRIVDGWNLFHPEKKISHFVTDDKGNVRGVLVNPSEIAAAGGVKDFGKIGPTKQQQPGIQLTPEAVQFFGQGVAQGVPMPNMGMGSSANPARAAVLNAAPGLANGAPLAASRATTRADTGSLANMQKMRDAVVSFENTANANLDIFTKAAKPIVDSGSPWINQPLRSINRGALGSDDLAAYDAARQIALTEVAKVVNNPGLSGQLSDNARREVMGLSPQTATLGNIYRVVGILRQDMANRHKFLDQSLGEIKGRMGGGAAAPAMAPAGSVVNTPNGPVDLSQFHQ